MAKNRFHSVEGEKYDFRKRITEFKKNQSFSPFFSLELVPVRTV